MAVHFLVILENILITLNCHHIRVYEFSRITIRNYICVET